MRRATDKEPRQGNMGLHIAIREIVKEEMTKQFINPQYTANKITQKPKPEREGNDWSGFETEACVQAFWEFCADRATKSGRSPRSISCKIRNLMRAGTISTW